MSTDPTDRRHAGAGPLAIWAGLLVIYLVWGSTYLGIRVAVETIPPLIMAAGRFLIAGVILYAFAIRGGDRAADRPGLREWRDATIAGALLLLGGMGLVAIGEQTVPSGIAALLVALMPLWLAVIGRVAFGQRLPVLVLGGIALGLAGVAILAWPTGSDRIEPFGLAAMIVSPISWATGSLFVAHRARQPRRPMVGTAMQMIAGGAVLAIAAIAAGELGNLRINRISTDSIVAFAYLTVAGSLFAFTVYGWLLRVAPLSLVGTYAYINPVVAVALGALLLNEDVSIRTVVAGAVIVVAVAIIVSARGRAARAASERSGRGRLPRPGEARAIRPDHVGDAARETA